MASGFPPRPAYPRAIDSDYTLFEVFNTAETYLSADNEAWADEIEIVPLRIGQCEMWPDNGFCTLEGELVYFDAVERNGDGFVTKLKRCARNLGGKSTKANAAGTWIRGFVIAEHHNQLVDAIFKLEDFVGINFDPRVETLDYRIRNLRETPVIFDDFACPDVTFLFEIIENNPASGITARYLVQINGRFDSFRLDFGDGEFTTNDLSGTHTYSINSQIDPVITLSNSKCQIIQTPNERENPTEPTPVQEPLDFNIPVPEIIDIPPIVIPSITIPPPEFDLPPTLFPCIDITPFPGISIGPIFVDVPSFIQFSPLNIPSVITITPINLPSVISITPIDFPSIIDFGPAPTFSPIGFGPAPTFSPIGFGPAPSISPIEFGPAPAIAPIEVDVNVNVSVGGVPSCIPICDSPSSITVDWGAPPTLNVAFVQQITGQSAKRKRLSKEDLALSDELEGLGDEFKDFFPDMDNKASFQIEYSSVGIPSEITILPPEFEDINVVHDLPTELRLLHDLPTEIRVVNSPEFQVPSIIQVVSDLPKTIELIATDIPRSIELIGNIPTKIELIGVKDIPKEITLKAEGIPETIQVVGIPKTIELIFDAPGIPLLIPDNLEIPLVFKGAPIEMKIEMPKEWSAPEGEEGDYPCVMIVPCPKK
jgi:hypothetical protein